MLRSPDQGRVMPVVPSRRIGWVVRTIPTRVVSALGLVVWIVLSRVDVSIIPPTRVVWVVSIR